MTIGHSAAYGAGLGRYEAWTPARGEEIIAEHLPLEGPALPIMHAMQEAFGYVPQDAVPMIADWCSIDILDDRKGWIEEILVVTKQDCLIASPRATTTQ